RRKSPGGPGTPEPAPPPVESSAKVPHPEPDARHGPEARRAPPSGRRRDPAGAARTAPQGAFRAAAPDPRAHRYAVVPAEAPGAVTRRAPPAPPRARLRHRRRSPRPRREGPRPFGGLLREGTLHPGLEHPQDIGLRRPPRSVGSPLQGRRGLSGNVRHADDGHGTAGGREAGVPLAPRITGVRGRRTVPPRGREGGPAYARRGGPGSRTRPVSTRSGERACSSSPTPPRAAATTTW